METLGGYTPGQVGVKFDLGKGFGERSVYVGHDHIRKPFDIRVHCLHSGAIIHFIVAAMEQRMADFNPVDRPTVLSQLMTS